MARGGTEQGPGIPWRRAGRSGRNEDMGGTGGAGDTGDTGDTGNTGGRLGGTGGRSGSTAAARRFLGGTRSGGERTDGREKRRSI